MNYFTIFFFFSDFNNNRIEPPPQRPAKVPNSVDEPSKTKEQVNITKVFIINYKLSSRCLYEIKNLLIYYHSF